MPDKLRLLPLIALFLFIAADRSATAAGLIDHRQTPFGSSRDEVIKQLRRIAGPVVKSEHTDSLAASLGVISTRSWRYHLKGAYQFHQGRLYKIDIRPFAEKGEAVPRLKLAELYRDLVGQHREDYGRPRLIDGKCGERAACRRTDWLLDHGKTVLSISEVLEPAKECVEISFHSVTIMNEIVKNEEKRKKKPPRPLPRQKAF